MRETLGERSEGMYLKAGSMMLLEDHLKLYIQEHEQLMKDLTLVRDMILPDCYIAAGYIRNYVWDRLHGFNKQEKHNDIDVVYFDLQNVSEERDRSLEDNLIKETCNEKWSVKNQARMHVKNGDHPYKCTEDAIAHWPETATAVGVRLDDNNEIKFISPYGLEDLFQMVVRRCPIFRDKEYYLSRVEGKNWINHWPLLKIIEE
jgi:hypothetical protein